MFSWSSAPTSAATKSPEEDPRLAYLRAVAKLQDSCSQLSVATKNAEVTDWPKSAAKFLSMKRKVLDVEVAVKREDVQLMEDYELCPEKRATLGEQYAEMLRRVKEVQARSDELLLKEHAVDLQRLAQSAFLKNACLGIYWMLADPIGAIGNKVISSINGSRTDGEVVHTDAPANDAVGEAAAAREGATSSSSSSLS